MIATTDIDRRLQALLRRQNGGESFGGFIGRISPQLPPPRHASALLRAVERALHERVFICCSMPPRHVKSTTFLHAIPYWVRKTPADTCGYFTYNDELARSKSRLARRLAQKAGVELASDSRNLAEWRTLRGGGLLAGGVGSALTGQGITGLMIVDDPFKNREEADSAVRRETVWQWFNEVVFTRLEGASVFVVQTRWHNDDLIGRLDKMGGWEIINLPAIAEQNDPLGRSEGQPLWPERYGLDELDAIRRQIGEYSFASLYQGRPRPRGANIFGVPERFELKGFDPQGCRIVIGVDPAASEKTSADYSAAVVLAIRGRGVYTEAFVLDVVRAQVSVPKLVAGLQRLQQKHWSAVVAVESVGAFKAVPQLLRQLDPSLQLMEVIPRGDKFTRAQPVAAAWNDGRVYVPTDAPWLPTFLAELDSFTGVKDAHDDQVDALAHAFNSVAFNRGSVRRGARLAPTRWRA